jgi:hypothetical protein
MGGSEWYFKSAGTEISCDRKDGPTLSSYRNWIVLTGMDAQRLAKRKPYGMHALRLDVLQYRTLLVRVDDMPQSLSRLNR